MYGEDKARTMARSLLPSKNRASARYERAHIHRSSRRQYREYLGLLVRDPEFLEDRLEPDEDAKGRIELMVSERRAGDKVAPFIRWARAITRPLPQECRLEHVRSLIPRGIIGDHALSHLSTEKGFEHPNETLRREAERRAWRSARSSPWMDPGEQAVLLRAILQAPGGHRAFNRWLRAACILGPLHTRTLLGEHDVLPFLASLWGPGLSRHHRPLGPYAEQAKHVNTFLRTFKELCGDVEATMKVLRHQWNTGWQVYLKGRPSP